MSVETKEKEPLVEKRKKTQAVMFAPQPPSALKKAASGGFLVGGVFCGIIALVLALTGSINSEILTTTAFFFLGAALALSRRHWASLLSILLGLVILYLVITQPYVITSLEHPRDDPQGGFGHFIGVVILIGCVLIALGASIANVFQDYTPGKLQTPRWFPFALTIIIGIVIGALLIGSIAPSAAAPRGLTYTNGVATVHLNGNAFLPAEVTLSKGSRLLLVDDTTIEHDLFNGNWQNTTPEINQEPGAPVVNNVKLSGNSVTIGPFSTAGTYHILCTIHQHMVLTIVVQ